MTDRITQLLGTIHPGVRNPAILEQGLVRFAYGLALVAFGLFLHLSQRALPLFIGGVMAIGVTAMALGWSILRYPRKGIGRRILLIVVDQLVAFALLWYAGEAGAVLVFAFLWITVAYGFRYGVRYLALAAVAGVGALGVLILTSEYWQSRWLIGVGVMIGNVVVSTYLAVLLDRIKTTNTKLANLATQDVVTGLPNRMLLFQRLREAIRRTRTRSIHAAVLLFDLDGFKRVNDEHGHAVGDDVLREIAARVKRHVRDGDTFGRLGGDEFLVVMNCRSLPAEPTAVAARIIAVIESIESVERCRVSLSASVGIAWIHAGEAGAGDADQLVRQADSAMYQAKEAGKGCYAIANGEAPAVIVGIRRANGIAAAD